MKQVKTGLLLSLAMTFALAGCTSGSGTTTSTATPNATAKASEPPAASKGMPDKFDPMVELKTVNFTYGVAKYGAGDDMNNNPWTRYLKDKLGIKLTTLWEVPSAELEQKTNLMIASGDIPDFFLANTKQFAQLVKAGMVEDLTKVYEQYAPDLVKQVIKDAGSEPLEAATVNGKLMGIPFTGVAKESVPVLWIREDWLKKVNLPAPKSMSDLLAISEAFTTKDPDGNGKADTFGLALDKDLSNINGFLNGFHAYKGIWIKDKDGKLAYSSIQPEMKTALGKMQEMFKNGQFDREFGVKDGPKVYESFGSGKIGMLFGSIGSANAPLSAQTPKTVWIPYPVPSIDSSPALLQHPLNLFNNGIWVVKKGAPRPEAVLKITELWLKFFYENTSDDIYKQYNYDLDSKVSNWMNAPIKIYKTFKNAQISTHLEPLLKSDKPATAADLAKLTPEEREVYQNIQKFKNGEVEHWYNNARSGLGGSGEIVNNYVKNNQFKPDLFITIPTPAMVQKEANLKKMELETFTKIILGASLDTFDQFVSDWKKLGGEDITKEVNEWYKSK